MKRGILFLFLVLTLSGLVSALGVSPASNIIDFVPNAEHELTYSVITDNQNAEMIIELAGDLAEYATLSEESVIGSSSFKVKIKLPESIERPGIHSIGVQVREKFTGGGSISTSVAIHSNIKVLVPYPGRYLEAKLNIQNGNVDEEIPFDIRVINRGSEILNVESNVQFFIKEGEFVRSLFFNSIIVEPTQEKHFKGSLDTSGFRPGDYFADASIDYGDIIKSNQTFRIGSLFVNVTNFTERLSQKGIQKFFIGIESRWNGNLDEVFADVNLTNDIQAINFRTPSIDLPAWERGTLVGFVDTDGLRGRYNTEIILNYAGQQTFAYGTLNIYKFSNLLIAGIIVGVIVVILSVVIFIVLRKKKKLKSKLKKLRVGFK